MEILCITSRISRLQCSIIYVIIAIIFFKGDRKPLNLKYWPENEEVQMAFLYNDFLQLFTTSFGAQSFGTLFFP